MVRPAATTVATAASEVPGWRITSTSGILATGLKKCMPTTFSGRRLAAARRAIGIAEVLEAKTRSAGAAASTSRITACLTSRSSNTASMTSGRRWNEASYSTVPWIRPIAPLASGSVRRRRFTSSRSCCWQKARPRPRAA